MLLLTLCFSAATANAAGTFVRTYADFISNTTDQKNVTPYDAQATADGGYILLATSDCTTPSCLSAETGNSLANWLVKVDSSGNPQWQKELGCFSLPPGDSTIGSSIQQTTDGGYIVGGGTTACGQPPECGGIFSVQCAIVEKLDSGGNLIWAKTYLLAPNGTTISSIKQSADGGYVAAGYVSASNLSGALLFKLDSSGNLQWQQTMLPAGSHSSLFNAVQTTSDGGSVAVGSYFTSSSQCLPYTCENALVVKFDAGGNIEWQEALAGTATVFTDCIAQTSDGGYIVGGSNGGGSHGAARLLVKLDSSGQISWQNEYKLSRGFGGVIYSVHQTADGGYVLAGDGDILFGGNPRLVPWIGKVDASGNPVWQYSYYVGAALSEWFQASVLAVDGGVLAAGWSQDAANKLGLLFVVKTDSSGLCGTCSDVHPATPVTVVNPGLRSVPVSAFTSSPGTPGQSSPAATRSTAIETNKEC